MARIISLETASTNCSVSVYQGSELLVLKEDPSPAYTHGELLHVFMDEALREAGLQWADLDAVAVSKGPGSYTGLRIGVAAAKGLCFALGIPLIAVETLKSMAYQFKDAEGVLIPMLDARRMEAYVAVFDADHNPIGPTRAEIISADSFSKWTAQGPVHLLGSGAEKCREVLKHPNFHFHTGILPGSKKWGCWPPTALKKECLKISLTLNPFTSKTLSCRKRSSRPSSGSGFGMNFALWEWNFNTFLVKALFQSFHNMKMRPPEIGILGPESEGEIHRAVGKLAHIDLGCRSFKNAFVCSADLQKDFLGFLDV